MRVCSCVSSYLALYALAGPNDFDIHDLPTFSDEECVKPEHEEPSVKHEPGLKEEDEEASHEAQHAQPVTSADTPVATLANAADGTDSDYEISVEAALSFADSLPKGHSA